MRLPDFILANIEPILAEWESFARSIWPGPPATSRVLRDHAEEMLRAVAKDMMTYQTDTQQSDKAKGLEVSGPSQQAKNSDRVNCVSDLHVVGRLSSGFELRELVAEYRALRASVIHLWVLSQPEPNPHEIQDIVRFNESIDQLLSESIASFARSVEASRDCFLGILGHDLRNPLAAATLLAYLLMESPTLDSQSLKMAATIRSSLDAMNLLVRDLLDFTGTRLGARMIVFPQSMDLQSLCEEVLDEMRAAHPSRTFLFISACDRDDLTGDWDGPRLRQLISNLLGNAVQHGASSSPVTLRAISAGADVHFAIHNFGKPIPEEMIGVIFDPMKRHLSPASAPPLGSVGLGLYIAREVANAHGGMIEVTSAREETVFTVKLPRHFEVSPDPPGDGQPRAQ